MYHHIDEKVSLAQHSLEIPTLDDVGGKGHAANVVLHLMAEKLDVWHSLFLNNS